MAHNVKCKICSQTFDRDTVQAMLVSPRRYAHLECIPEEERAKYTLVPLQQEKKDEDLVKLENYIMELFDTTYINPRIRKQIKQYIEEYNYTYKGILKSLIYFYEVKKNIVGHYNDTLGIVPYIYEEAKKYYYALYMARLSNQQVQVQKQFKVVEYTIQQPESKKRNIKLFTFEEDQE